MSKVTTTQNSYLANYGDVDRAVADFHDAVLDFRVALPVDLAELLNRVGIANLAVPVRHVSVELGAATLTLC